MRRPLIAGNWKMNTDASGGAELAAAIQADDTGIPSTLIQEYRQAQKEGNPDIDAVLVGEGVGLIDSLEPAYDIVRRIDREAQETIQSLTTLVEN